MDLDNLDLRKLRAFYFVARHGSLQRAAARLNVTVSAVSFSIQRLEEQLGIQLFQRMPNKLVLTSAGLHFVDSAEAIFAGINKVLADSALDVMPSGRLYISVTSDLAWYFIPRIRDFLKVYPDIELGVYIKTSSEALRLVERREIDLGIGRFTRVPNTLEMKQIIETSVSLVCLPDHPLARRKVPRLQDLARYKLITLPDHHSTRRMIDAGFAKAEVYPGSYIEAGNCHAVCEFVDGGLGVGLIHTFCSRRAASADLHYVDLNRYFGKGTFSAVYQKQAGHFPALFKSLQDALLPNGR
jgi:DNA-binding transcriptional LysR family regulator